MYTVKQLSELARVSVRTLHYYDEIALLTPSKVGANGYRYYDDESLLRLQQILFYREIGLELMQIKPILDERDFDRLTALRQHRAVLQAKTLHLHDLIETIDHTIAHLEGEPMMDRKGLFRGFDAETQKQYEREARLQYGPTTVNESVKRWSSYTKAQQEAILAEGGAIYMALAEAIVAGKPAHDADVQAILSRWHLHIHHFYEPTLEILRGLGDLYNTSPDFMATFQQFHAGLPAYLQESISKYVDELEYAEIAQMLEDDEKERMNG